LIDVTTTFAVISWKKEAYRIMIADKIKNARTILYYITSIGIAAAKKRVSTYFIKCNDLLQQLKRAQLENRLDARLKHFSKYRLLIIDEIGYLPINKEDSNLFFQLTDMRYEKKSTILTTNMNFNEWDGVFYDAVVANAIMDRILHHAHVIPISGKSYRLKDHLKAAD